MMQQLSMTNVFDSMKICNNDNLALYLYAVIVIRKVLKGEVQFRPAVARLTGYFAAATAEAVLIHDGRSSQHFVFATSILDQKTGVWTPDDLHSGPPSRFYTRYTVLED